MAYVPLSGYLTQLITQTGQVASDYYIKFYIANTTTPLSMATNQGAVTLLVKAKFNNNGMPISNPLDNSTEFIPHLNQSYRLVVYRNEADADADNTADSYVNIPEIYALLSASNIGTAADQIPLNSDLGSASLADLGLLAGNAVPGSSINAAGDVWGASNVEYGTNATGDFWKYPDGSLICARSITCQSSGFITYNFPHVFVGNARVVGTTSSSATDSILNVKIANRNTTSFQCAVPAISQAGAGLGYTAIAVDIVAIGRWK
jgi:hypothetical protein